MLKIDNGGKPSSREPETSKSIGPLTPRKNMPKVQTPVVSKTVFSDDEIKFVADATEEVLRSGWLVLGKFTALFEKEWAARVNCQYAVAVSSGTAALEIIFRSLDITGRDVLVPSNTNFATVAAVLYAGGTPVLYDGGLYFDLADIERKLTNKTAAIVVVHIAGYISPEIVAVRDLC